MNTHPKHLALAALVALAAGSSARAQGTQSAPPTLEQVQRSLASTQEETARLEARSRQLAQEQAGLGPRVESARSRARSQLRVLYHLTQQRPLTVWAGPEAVLDGLSRQATLRRAAQSTLAELRSLQERAATVQTEREQTARLLAEASARRVQLERSRTQSEALAGWSLAVTNAGLVPEGAQGAGPVTVYGGAAGTVNTAVGRFADAAGRLLFPIAGRAEVRRAQREGAAGQGLEVLAALGSPVRATYPGRVAFADRYGPYGLLVIVDHGEHYYTVSANLGSIAVQVGQELTAGAILGTVGDEGRGPRLYLEVRRGRETLDPGPWFGIQ